MYIYFLLFIIDDLSIVIDSVNYYYHRWRSLIRKEIACNSNSLVITESKLKGNLYSLKGTVFILKYELQAQIGKENKDAEICNVCSI